MALTESGAVPIVVSGPDGAVLAANQAALRLLGRTEAELVGARIDDLVGAGESENALGPRPDRVRATPLPTPPEAGIIWVLDGEQQIRDDLTGLANRRLYQDRLAHAIATARRRQEGFAVCVLDLNAFKDVNDMLGYDLGDVLLRMLGERLAEALRASDTLARVGGDEFAIILPSCDDAEAAATVAGKLITELQRPFEIEGREVDVTASLGIAIYPRDGESAEHLMSRAELAMYEARDELAGQSVYELHERRTPERVAMAGQLKRAIERNELLLEYQPQIRLADGMVIGAEALVRWKHPERGVLAPGEFIPLAEQSGIVHGLTLWVMRQALEQASKWTALGLDLVVSVNLSPRDLQQPGFPHAIAEITAVAGIDPARVKLEITEGVLMRHPELVIPVLRQLRAMGLGLAIDDFGTGYASLAYLKNLPVTELKIGDAFVEDLATDPDDDVIVRSTIDLAHRLGLTVVAEGVRDRTALARLKEHGCDLAQGYLLGRPASAARLAAMAKRSPAGRGGAN